METPSADSKPESERAIPPGLPILVAWCETLLDTLSTRDTLMSEYSDAGPNAVLEAIWNDGGLSQAKFWVLEAMAVMQADMVCRIAKQRGMEPHPKIKNLRDLRNAVAHQAEHHYGAWAAKPSPSVEHWQSIKNLPNQELPTGLYVGDTKLMNTVAVDDLRALAHHYIDLITSQE